MARPKAVLETDNAPPRPTRAEREQARRAQAKTKTKQKPLAERIRVPGRNAARLKSVPLRRPMERRYRQTVRSVDLWTVLKVSVCFYLCGLIVTLGAGIVLWWIASGIGVIHNIENFIADLTGADNFEFLSWRILRGATLIGLVVVCLQVVCTVLAAAFYNLFAQLLGGIEITVVEEEPAV